MGGERQLPEIVDALRARPDSRAACTAGSSSPMSVPMMAITTSNSTSVNAERFMGSLAWLSFPRPGTPGEGE